MGWLLCSSISKETTPRWRRRRHLKPQVRWFGALFLILVGLVVHEYQYIVIVFETEWLSDMGLEPSPLVTAPSSQIVLKDTQGNAVVPEHRSSSLRLADFLPLDHHQRTNDQNISKAELQQVIDERLPLLTILTKAGISWQEEDNQEQPDTMTKMLSPQDSRNRYHHILQELPTWKQVDRLYHSHSGPKFLDDFDQQCQIFQQQVALSDRFIGIAGMFNSGTTAFAISLQANCYFPDRDDTVASNDVVTNVHGVLNQVPWAKHKHASLRWNHTIHEGIRKDNVLPVILVRDPYFWMQSMCHQGYGARWDHNPAHHCPNLVPNDYDRQRFKHLREASHVPVWMGAHRPPSTSMALDETNKPSGLMAWPSLVHYWNDWHQSYLRQEEPPARIQQLSTQTSKNPNRESSSSSSFPRIFVRFEDTLFHGKEVVNKICQCGGGTFRDDDFQYLVDEAKWNHKQSTKPYRQNNLVTAMIRYGKEASRYQNMTHKDLEFAKQHLDANLMDLFHYQQEVGSV